MKKSMCITYEVGSGLYVNVTNRCTNRCSFCIRNNGDGAYGSDSLWLSHEPSAAEIIESIDSRDMSKYSELVFCGYGEPSERLSEVREVALYVKKKYPRIPIRINTNGHSDLILGRDSTPMYDGAFDVVSISLNTSNSEKYVDMCHPVYKEKAFEAILVFAKNVKKYVQKVLFTVVYETLSEKELSECQKIAEDLGITLKVRTYISK